MKLLNQIHEQRLWFLQQNLKPTVLLCPLDLRHQLLGECAERFLVDYSKGVDRLNVMGLRVHFVTGTRLLEVALTRE